MRTRNIILLLLAVLSLPLLCSPAYAELRTVTVGVYENAPKVFTVHGKPTGIFIDVIEEIAKKEGWRLKYVHGTWSEGLSRLSNGEIDLMPDVAYTAEREMQFDFHTVPVLSVWSQVYARKGSGIQSVLDLEGKSVAALEETIQLETFKRLVHSFELKITLVPVPDYQTEFQMIHDGKVAAGVTNRFYGLKYARNFGLEDTPIIFDPAPFFFAARRDTSAPLLQAIDRDLTELKRDPRSAYYASLKRWTSEDVQLKVPDWVKIAGGVAALALVISLWEGVILKRRVNARTRELELANDEFKASEQRYRHLFEQNPAPMLIYRRGSLEMLAVNDAFVNHYGYSRDQALSFLLTDLYPDNEKELITKVAAGLKGHAYVGEWHHLKADGTVITIGVRSHDIEYWGQNARIAVITDITQTKRMEEELRNINDTLDVKVRERTAELSAANAELAAANEKLTELERLKSMFIASMSHELRTPLNSIIGFTGILLQEMAGPLNEEQHKQLSMVKSSSRHLLELITDIIDLSKIEAGKINVSFEPFDLAAVAREVLETFRVEAGRKSLALTFDGPEQLLVQSDSRRVRQVLVNLIGNAVKFTDQGEVGVVIGTGGVQATVAVRDSGPGIREQDMDKLFRFFSQITTSDLPKHEGTGLGLYISRKLMNMLGGDIRAESEFGSGSVFTLSLPLTLSAGRNSADQQQSSILPNSPLPPSPEGLRRTSP